MVAGHIILRHLPLILHLLFREEVLGKALLQERVTLVLLIPQHRGFDTKTYPARMLKSP